MIGLFKLVIVGTVAAATAAYLLPQSEMGSNAVETNSVVVEEDPDESIYRTGVELAKNEKYREAIEIWRSITNTSSYYQKAQASIQKALEFQGKRSFEQGMVYESTGNTKGAVESWRAVPKGSSYYEKALQELRRFPPAGSIVNPLKQIVFWTGVGVAGSSAVFGILGILDNIRDAGLLAEYNRYDATKTTAQYDAIWSDHLSTVYGGNIKNIICYSTAIVSLGLFAWWLLLPDHVPEAKATKAYVIPSAAPNCLAVNIIYRF